MWTELSWIQLSWVEWNWSWVELNWIALSWVYLTVGQSWAKCGPDLAYLIHASPELACLWSVPARAGGLCDVCAAGHTSAMASALVSEGHASQRGDPGTLAASAKDHEQARPRFDYCSHQTRRSPGTPQTRTSKERLWLTRRARKLRFILLEFTFPRIMWMCVSTYGCESTAVWLIHKEVPRLLNASSPELSTSTSLRKPGRTS